MVLPGCLVLLPSRASALVSTGGRRGRPDDVRRVDVLLVPAGRVGASLWVAALPSLLPELTGGPRVTVTLGSCEHVFVSYARRDGGYVARLVEHLRARGLDVWTDAAIDLGHEWLRALQESLDGCAALVVVMSPAAEESEWVRREVLRALDKGKPVFPLLLVGEPLFAVGNLQYEPVPGGRMPSPRWVDHVRATVDAAPARPRGNGGAGARPASRPPTTRIPDPRPA